jgi:hypothetical protein
MYACRGEGLSFRITVAPLPQASTSAGKPNSNEIQA